MHYKKKSEHPLPSAMFFMSHSCRILQGFVIVDAFKILPSESSVNNKSKKETDRQTDINFIAEYISFAYLNVKTSFLTLSGYLVNGKV